MNCIDLNEIGRTLFKQRYNIEDKRKLTFEELQWYINNIFSNYKDNSTKLLNEINKNNLINNLNDILLLCYITNININNYIHVKVKDEENK